jgi:hypothetical protein
MVSRHYLPQLVQCDVTAAEGTLDVSAKRSEDQKHEHDVPAALVHGGPVRVRDREPKSANPSL